LIQRRAGEMQHFEEAVDKFVVRIAETQLMLRTAEHALNAIAVCGKNAIASLWFDFYSMIGEPIASVVWLCPMRARGVRSGKSINVSQLLHSGRITGREVEGDRPASGIGATIN
jgi:hypothetical protein